MIYGTLELQQNILETAKGYANEYNLKLVYGVIVGSNSKGFEYADSDCDTRFLYVREDFPQKICVPWEMTEEELVKRFYPMQECLDECLPFWELTSFLHFLTKPSFNNVISSGLYNMVGWTFQSPYQWDPYGIRNKIMPLIDDIFIKEYEIMYHLREIERWYKKDDRKIIAKNYMYSVHAALTIDWCLQRNAQPPVYYKTLLGCCASEQIADEVDRLVKTAQQEAGNVIVKNHMQDRQETHFTIMAEHSEVIDAYIERMYKKGTETVNSYKISPQMLLKCQKNVRKMCGILMEEIS
nr:nucleotidyltransferase domain-containing protein [uncultured Roseburia sp.]